MKPSARIFPIVSRHKAVLTRSACETDLMWNEDIFVAPRFAEEYSFTPYCIDEAGKNIIEVGIPSERRSEPRAFFYLDQYYDADVVRLRPMKQLKRTDHPDPIGKLIFIFSIGRSGSTLVSKLLNTGDTFSVSEPDFLSQLSNEYKVMQSGVGKKGWQNLYRWCLSSIQRHFDNPSTLAVKFRNQSSNSYHVRNLYRCFPRSKFVMIFRNIDDWSLSYARKFHVDRKTLDSTIRGSLESALMLVKLNANLNIYFYEDIVANPEYFLRTCLERELGADDFKNISDVMLDDSQKDVVFPTSDNMKMERALLERDLFLESWRKDPPMKILQRIGLGNDRRLIL